MALETIRVYSVDQDNDPLAGVLVRVFDALGATFISQNYTAIVGSDAYCEFTLDGDDPPISYTIRLSKTGVAFDGSLGVDNKTPQIIEVYSPPSASPSGTNWFQAKGQTFVRPVSPDPRLCRCSGFFRDITGRPLPHLNMFFRTLNQPIIVDDDGVLGSYVEGRTDSEGYFQIDLFRNGQYEVILESLEDINRDITVPDTTSANLINVLFAYVKSLVFTPDTVSVTIGDYIDVDLEILDCNGVELDPIDGDLLFTSDDTDVATCQIIIGSGKLRVVGVGVGTAQITATRADTSICVVPTELDYTPLSVTVS